MPLGTDSYIADATGKPMHGWRVLILPFLEQSAVYNQYDFSEPWDGPNNPRMTRSAAMIRLICRRPMTVCYPL
ncbi:MAG TPA: DUF1559 domain-containing protein [Isosphaeraceae bacterium]|nr:DUF1559 domain-containing protein [Isosphaeraceae bacterium]